jgi:hypothetical protein
MDWTHLSQNIVQWQSCVDMINVIKNLVVSQKAKHFCLTEQLFFFQEGICSMELYLGLLRNNINLQILIHLNDDCH